jgi:hypothetical protein
METGVKTMLRILWSPRNIALAVAMIALACAVGFSFPRPLADSGMSAEWHCSTIAGILTSCTKNHV